MPELSITSQGKKILNKFSKRFLFGNRPMPKEIYIIMQVLEYALTGDKTLCKEIEGEFQKYFKIALEQKLVEQSQN